MNGKLSTTSSQVISHNEQDSTKFETEIKDPDLAQEGHEKIKNAKNLMSGMNLLINNDISSFENNKPLKGAKIAFGLHVDCYNAVLAEYLIDSGADLRWVSTTVHSTDDSVAAAIADMKIPIAAWKTETEDNIKENIKNCLFGNFWRPTIIVQSDSLMTEILLDEIETRKRNSGNKHKLQKNDSISSMNFKGVIDKSVAGAEYFLSLENSNNLDFTVINLQNTVSGNILNKVLFPRETIINILRLPGFTIISNKLVMIIGYGNTGSTLAKVLLSSHCSVYIVEKDPCRALKAAVNGLKTVSLNDYIDVMDIVICSTQAKGIMHADLLKKLKPNSILCNMSNNKKEIDTSWLVKNSKMVPHNPNVDKVFLDPDDENKFFYLITKGINAGVEAFNLPEICMSMNCVLMSLAIFELHMSKGCKYNRKVYELPKKLDTYAARIHLPHFHAHTNKNE